MVDSASSIVSTTERVREERNKEKQNHQYKFHQLLNKSQKNSPNITITNKPSCIVSQIVCLMYYCFLSFFVSSTRVAS